MKSKRKRHDAAFKARVALEAIKGERTIQAIAKEYDLHPVQVSDWKKIMIDGAAEAFSPGRGSGGEGGFDQERKKLHAKIGELTIDVDFLREKSKQLGL